MSTKRKMHQSLEYIIHHVILPPQLPQESDNDLIVDIALIQEVRDAVADYLTSNSTNQPQLWKPCLTMLSRMMISYPSDGTRDSRVVERQVREMEKFVNY